MAYTEPTADDLQTRFPAFAAVDDAIVTQALVEAESYVDESWLEEDFALARMLYAAHTMTLDGHGTGMAPQIAGLAGVKSVKSGALSFEMTDGASAGSTSLLDKTTYGQRFKALQRKNKPFPTARFAASCC